MVGAWWMIVELILIMEYSYFRKSKIPRVENDLKNQVDQNAFR